MNTICIVMIVFCFIAFFAFACIMLEYNNWYWCAIAYLRISEPKKYKAYKEAQKMGVKVYLLEENYTRDRLDGKLPKYFLFPYYYEGGIHFALCTIIDGYRDIITDFWPLTEKLQKKNKWNNQL